MGKNIMSGTSFISFILAKSLDSHHLTTDLGCRNTSTQLRQADNFTSVESPLCQPAFSPYKHGGAGVFWPSIGDHADTN